MENAILLVSGGLDSVTMYHKLKQTYNVFPVYINYGQLVSVQEKKALRKTIGKFKEIKINLESIFDGKCFAFNKNSKDFPLATKPVINEFIPGRNVIFLSLLLPMIYYNKISVIAVGCQKTDQMPDNNPNFYKKFTKVMNTALDIGGKKNIKVIFPLFNLEKNEVVMLAKKLGYNYSDTWSCYDFKNKHCGKCWQCIERKEAFKLANVKDETKYEIKGCESK